MTGLRSIDRRTLLETLGAIITALVGPTIIGPVLSQRGNAVPARSDPLHETYVTGVYGGTVDRIVDGEHVVILIEDGDTVIDQRVVSADVYPALGEGDPVSLILLHGRVLTIT